MHFYRFHIGDYRKDTGHLTLLEHGIYRALLDTYYLEERPLCADVAKLMRTHGVRMEDEQKAFENVLNDFFYLTENGFEHKKCNEQLLEIYAKSQKASESAKARWSMEKSKNAAESSTCENNDMRTQCERNANASKNDAFDMLPITHNPIPKEKTQKRFDPLAMPLPQNVSLEKWKEWIAYRKDQKFKSAQATLKKQLEFLEGQGNDAGLIIDETIRNGWHGLFPLKNRPSAPPEPIKASVEIKWHETAEGFKAKGAELGVIQHRGELFADFQQRVIDAFKQQRGSHAA